MKKMRPLYLVLAFMLIIAYSCETREETKQPKADFNFTPTSDIKTGDEVTFNNLSTDAETYSWDFKDGSTSVAQHPKHEFKTAGEWDVTLVVSNKNLKDQISKKVIVTSTLEACFTMSPNPAMVDENVTFSNCSEGAETYEWYIGTVTTVQSTAKDPVFFFSEAGTFNVKLIVKSGSESDEVVHSITINANTIEIDPRDYNGGIPGWVTHYYNDFSESGDWYEGSGEDYTLSIANGVYTMVDINNADDHYGYFVSHDEVSLPTTGNYDYEARIKNRVDNAAWGSGLIYGGLDFDYNYFKFSIGLYRIGDTGDGDWVEWTETTDGNIEDWNKLTVRKYQNKYYFFMNEVFLYEDDFSDYGNEFGFGFDQNTTVDIDAVGIYIMDLSGKKSATIKQEINTENKSKPNKIKLAPKDSNPLR